jgi:Domain of unknown function (DUF4412)
MIRPVLLLTLIAAPLSAQAFEGVISMTINADGGRSIPVVYQVKNGKLRYDMAAGMAAGAIIVDPGDKKMIMLMPAQRMAMETEFAGVVAGMAERAAAGKQPVVTRTGRTEIVAGYKCEHVIVTGDDTRATDVCLTNDIAAPFQMPGGGFMGMGALPQWAAQIGNAFPLKVEQAGRTVVEVTKVEKKALEDELFTVPEGFQRMSMPNIRRP